MSYSQNKDFKCVNCGMQFNSLSMLQKHKTSYCIGHPREYYLERPDSGKSDYSSHNHSRAIANKQRKSHQRYKSDRYESDNSSSSRTQLKPFPGPSSQNDILQRQITEVNNRLAHLGTGSSKPTMDVLRNQQSRNTNLLHSLQTDFRQRTYFPPNGSLLQEIRALRQQYLANGGRDAAILGQIADVESAIMELTRLNNHVVTVQEQQRNTSQGHDVTIINDNRENYDSLSHLLLEFEEENHLLESELLSLQESNNGQLVNTARDDRLSMEEQLQHRQYMFRMSELERQMELVQQQLKLEKLMLGLKSSHTQSHVAPSKIVTPKMYDDDKDLFMSDPYDARAGFMVFYDFVVGLSPATQLLRLVVGLYNLSNPYCDPTIFPTVSCQFNVQDGLKSAVIGARQPAPGCTPNGRLVLVIEVQTTENHNEPMTTRGWCSVPLFDYHKRLISGRWRLPLRIPPIRPNMVPADQNALSQLGLADIYLRVANWRDIGSQTKRLLSLAEAYRYQYHTAIQSDGAYAQAVAAERTTSPWGVPPSLLANTAMREQTDFLRLSSADDGQSVGTRVARGNLATRGGLSTDGELTS